ncbi:MAG: AbrB/MazE/SpoVT family DNA-binding domain-containing protein [Chloroflexi bacterium]|nr:AbrB/MazE/SpoVT family DNA-binding domain-containing protein [Chloroflexota bacterium]
MLVKIGPRGQITIPKSLRRSLGIKPGDSLAITQTNGELALQPVQGTIFDLVGSIPVDGPQDFDKIRERAKQHVAQKMAKELTGDE